MWLSYFFWLCSITIDLYSLLPDFKKYGIYSTKPNAFSAKVRKITSVSELDPNLFQNWTGSFLADSTASIKPNENQISIFSCNPADKQTNNSDYKLNQRSESN